MGTKIRQPATPRRVPEWGLYKHYVRHCLSRVFHIAQLTINYFSSVYDTHPSRNVTYLTYHHETTALMLYAGRFGWWTTTNLPPRNRQYSWDTFLLGSTLTALTPILDPFNKGWSRSLTRSFWRGLGVTRPCNASPSLYVSDHHSSSSFSRSLP